MIYEIQNDLLKVRINSTGAELYSLKSKTTKIEYIWSRDSKYWSYCAPVLFPIVGALKDKKTIIQNKEYKMNNHGFLRTQEFELFQKSDTEISFINTFNEETLELYPFRYKVLITFTLNGSSLKTNFQVINENKEPILFNIGGHPAFNCPLYEGEKFTDYRIEFETEEAFSSPKVENDGTLNFDEPVMRFDYLKEIKLDYELFKIDTIVIPRIRSNSVKLLNKENKGLKLSFSRFKSFGIWTPYGKDAPFICLEPWLGYGDRHNSKHLFHKKDDIVSLRSLEDFNASYDIEIIE